MASYSLPESSNNSFPQKEFLQFEPDTENLSEQTKPLVSHIKKVAECLLYHWKSFPIILPSPIAVQHSTTLNTVNTYEQNDSLGGPENISTDTFTIEQPLILRDVFVAPSFDELDSVALNSKGDPHQLTDVHLENIRDKGLSRKSGKRQKLNEYQLDMLQRTGEFEVESLHFPGQSHRWRLSECLQKGSERVQEDFLNDVAQAASFLFVTARNRYTSPYFSVAQAGRSLWTGFSSLLDLMFGIPWLQAHNLDQRMKEERCSYLVQELSLMDGDIRPLCSWLKQQISKASREKYQPSQDMKQPAISYQFCTPQGQQLDLRLFNRELMKKALPVLVTILEKEARGWFLHFREKTICELKNQGLSDPEVEKECNQKVQQEYLAKVYDSILINEDLLELGLAIPGLLVDQAKAVLLMYQALDEVEKIYEEGERSRREELKHTQPILSRISSWLQEDLITNQQILMDQHKWRPHEHALSLCRQNGLTQHAYFLQRDLSFMREREPVLQKELRDLKVPSRVFEWRNQIWFPNNFIVNRSFQGDTEVIPTVLANSTTTITAPRSDPNQPIFLLEKQRTHTTTTRWPFWRWYNFIHRTWSLTRNVLYFFAIWLPFCSSLSLRALFSFNPFMADCVLSQVNGTVCPSKSSMTPTMCSRLLYLWRHISKSRTHFETLPDTGFIGKGVSRHLNRLWNYLVKGFLGTLFLTTIFPITGLVVSFSSLLIALAAPIWVPLAVFLAHIIFILVYDVDSPGGRNRWVPLFEALFWHILCLGLLQPIAAVLFASFICPVLALGCLSFACIRWGLRRVWDTAMFHCIIKKRGRIPASNSILVKRVAGPGLHDDFVYQISCEQAIAALESRLESEKLSLFQRDQELLISKPLIIYSDFIRQCFGPFSGVCGKSGQYGRVEKEVKDATQALHQKVDKRRRELSLGLPAAVRSKIKMTTRDLKQTLKAAAITLESFYPQHIFSNIIGQNEEDHPVSNNDLLEEVNTLLRQGVIGRVIKPPDSVRKCVNKKGLFDSEEQWWDSKGLMHGDYTALATLLFTEIFSTDFLTPMDDNETSFQMEVQGANLSRYTKLLHSLPDRPDIEERLTVHSPRGNINVLAPFLDITSFTPIIRHVHPTHKEKTSLAARLSLRMNPSRRSMRSTRVPEKLLIPPPVPHPAQISVIIHNRDAVDPIPLDSLHTKQVLSIIEDSPQLAPHMDTFSLLGDETSQISDSQRSSLTRDDISMYDDPSIYSRRSDTIDRHGTHRSNTTSRSRTATLEMTATLDKHAKDQTRSSTLESFTGRASSWLSSPLRTLLEGTRPFSVNLNLASAEEASIDGDTISPTSSSHTTAV